MSTAARLVDYGRERNRRFIDIHVQGTYFIQIILDQRKNALPQIDCREDLCRIFDGAQYLVGITSLRG